MGLGSAEAGAGSYSPTLAHVHETAESVASVEFTPPHPPREETPEYRKAHNFLINQQNRGCLVCGVTKKDLQAAQRAKLPATRAAHNPYGATQIESHHYPIERSLLDACDPAKVHRAFPQVYDRASLETFVDSPANLIVLCDVHHRSPTSGIHHLLTQDWAVLPFLWDGYVVAGRPQDAAADLTRDEAIEQTHGLEPVAAVSPVATTSPTRVETVSETPGTTGATETRRTIRPRGARPRGAVSRGSSPGQSRDEEVTHAGAVPA